MKTKSLFLFLIPICLLCISSCISNCNCDEITYNQDAKVFVKGTKIYSGNCTSINNEKGNIVITYKNGKIIKATSKFVGGEVELLGNNEGIISIKYKENNGELGTVIECQDGNHYDNDFADLLTDGIYSLYMKDVINSKPNSYAKDINGEKFIDFYADKKPITVGNISLNILAEFYYIDNHKKDNLRALLLENPNNGKIVYDDYGDIFTTTPEKMIKSLIQSQTISTVLYDLEILKR
jgi:hypothetical protein